MKRRLSAPYPVALVGVLTRELPTRLIELSRSGCLLESGQRIDEGTVGALRLEVEGRSYAEDVRVTRCVAVAGSGSSYLLGVEFLQTAGSDGASIRRVLAGSVVTAGDIGPNPSGSLSLL